MTGDAMPRSFNEEVCEIMQDLYPDFQHTLLQLDQAMVNTNRAVLLKLIKHHGQDVGALLDSFSTLMIWNILIGREHHARGYAAPVLSEDRNVDDIPDFLSGMFDDQAQQ